MDLQYFIKKQDRLIVMTDLKFIRQDYYPHLVSKERLVGLVGARGVGKTTLLLQYLKQLNEQSLYLIGDDLIFTSVNLYDVVDEFYALGGRIVVVDEVHKYPNWAQEIKNIYDSFPDMQIRISGSSMINIIFEKYDLSRRLVLFHVKTLSFREYFELIKGVKFNAYTLDEILNNAPNISKELVFQYKDLFACFKQYLKNGAYPFYLEGLDSFDQKLFNALDKIVYEDIPSLNKIDYSHVSIFKKLIYMIISSKKPFQVNVTELAKTLGVSQPTLYTYLDILDNTGIFKPLKKFSTKLSKKPQKLLLANTNILYSYAQEFNKELEIGTIRETYFASCFEEIYYSDIGDFRVKDIIFEVGGKNKSFAQIKDIDNAYLAVDIDYTTNVNKIPLWLFGFIL